MTLRLNRKQLLDLIESIEAGGGDASALRHELEALGPDQRPRRRAWRNEEEAEETTEERLNNRVGDLFPKGISEVLAKLIDLDRNYSLKDLRAMCLDARLSPSGDKKELAAKLVAKGVL